MKKDLILELSFLSSRGWVGFLLTLLAVEQKRNDRSHSCLCVRPHFTDISQSGLPSVRSIPTAVPACGQTQDQRHHPPDRAVEVHRLHSPVKGYSVGSVTDVTHDDNNEELGGVSLNSPSDKKYMNAS